MHTDGAHGDPHEDDQINAEVDAQAAHDSPSRHGTSRCADGGSLETPLSGPVDPAFLADSC
eukprot:3791316-Prymnesium_polylepis.1